MSAMAETVNPGDAYEAELLGESEAPDIAPLGRFARSWLAKHPEALESETALIAALRDEFDLDLPETQASLRATAVQQYQDRETQTEGVS